MTEKKFLDLVDAMLIIIRLESIDYKTSRMAASIISADANFNYWVSEKKKCIIEIDEMSDLLEFSESTLREARAIALDAERGVDNQVICSHLKLLLNKFLNLKI